MTNVAAGTTFCGRYGLILEVLGACRKGGECADFKLVELPRCDSLSCSLLHHLYRFAQPWLSDPNAFHPPGAPSLELVPPYLSLLVLFRIETLMKTVVSPFRFLVTGTAD